MAQLLAICSGKGGTGKSTLSVLLARALASGGNKVLLVDFDAGLRCLDTYQNVASNVLFDLGDVLCGRPVQDAVLKTPTPNICLLAAPLNEFDFCGKPINSLFSHLVSCYDVIIADLPAGINSGVLGSFPEYTNFIIVSKLSPVSLRDAGNMSDTLNNLGFVPSLVINCFDKKLIKSGTVPNLDDIVDTVCAKLLGIVPFDSNIELFSYNTSFLKHGYSLSAALRIAQRLEGQIVPLPNPNTIKTR